MYSRIEAFIGRMIFPWTQAKEWSDIAASRLKIIEKQQQLLERASHHIDVLQRENGQLLSRLERGEVE